MCVGWEELEEQHTIERNQNMHRMKTYIWKQVQEASGASRWNSRYGVGKPEIWRAWPAWSLAAVGQREFSQGITGMYKDSEIAPTPC